MASKPKRLPSGNWNTQVHLPNGRRKSITDPLKRVVEQKARDLEAAAHRGGYVPPDQRLTVESWAGKWFAARNVEPTTAAKNASHWKNHIKPHWGGWPLTSIDRLDVLAWVNEMHKAGVGPSTIAASYNLLSKMLGDAVLSKKLHASPCVEITLPKVVKPAERWLTRHEYDRIQLALALTPRALNWQAYVALGCFSGLRCPSELAGLDVPSVDLERGLVHVTQTVTRHGLKPYGKTDGSMRWVPFPPEVGRLLWRLIGDRAEGPVFTSPEGNRVNEANFRNRVWRPALAEAGVEYIDPYSMRHTAASWLAQAGVSSDEIADILGHSSTRMVSVYRHMRPDVHDRVRAAWAADSADAQATHAEKQKSPSPGGLGL
jgi:integrase